MSLVDIDVSGHRYKKGCKVWPVGTWPLKGAFYADLRKEGRRAGAELDPPGYCHFGAWLDEGYFRQITSEYLVEETYRGRPRTAGALGSVHFDQGMALAGLVLMPLLRRGARGA